MGHGSPEKERPSRLDLALVSRGLAESREKAQALIMSGVVAVDGRPASKSSEKVTSTSHIVIRGPDHPYVGRGGLKLAGALDRFRLDPAGRVALDVGASTGGFTDCLLQRGCLRVYALDVGRGQIHDRLRRDPRVVVLERINARYLRPDSLPEMVHLAVVDVSFISLKMVLPPLVGLLKPDADLLPLVKPQFEVGRREVGKGGLVRDPALHRRVVQSTLSLGQDLGMAALGVCASSVTGAEGNQEYFVHFREGGPSIDTAELNRQLEEALNS